MSYLRHNKCLSLITSIILLICLLACYPQAVTANSLSLMETEVEGLPLATGVQYSAYNIEGVDYQQAVKVLTIDPGDQFTLFETALSSSGLAAGREKPTAMAARLSGEERVAVAATNGDFYSTRLPYLPIGMQISNGELLISPQGFPALGLTKDKQAFIAVPVMDAYVSVKRAIPGPKGESINQTFTYPLSRINRERGSDMLVLYTSAFAASTATNDYGTEVILKDIELPLEAGNTYRGIVATKIKNKGDNLIPRDGVILSGHGKAQEFLDAINPGDKVELVLKFTDPRWHEVEQAIGGRDILLVDGKVALPADTKDTLITSRHPRTAIGLKPDGRLEIVVVDGRQPGYSDGMTLFELAAFMQKRGIVTALNLDGGGSSVLAARNVGEYGLSLLSRPAGGQERNVTNALVVFTTAPQGELTYLYILPGAIKLYQGSRVQFDLRAQDNYYNPAPLPDKVTWQQKGNLGDFVAPGVFKAKKPGKGEIIAAVGDKKANSQVTVVDKIHRLVISPDIVLLRPGSEQQFTVTAYDAEGDEIIVDNALYQWTMNEGLGLLDEENGVLQVKGEPRNAWLKVRLGDQEAVAKINPELTIVLEGQPLTGQELSLVVRHDGVPLEGVTIRQIQPAATIGEVTASALNVRSGPGTEHKVMALLPRGQKVTVVEKLANNWLRIQLPGGQEGYVAAEYVLVQAGSRVLGQTDSQGRVKFTATLAGNYSFEAVKEGYLSGRLEQVFSSR